jgi:hypothetical protein
MSGTLQDRVNRSWDSTTQVNRTAARFFWDWLHFINDHGNLAIIQVGTGTTSYGTSIPAAWLTWNGVVNPTGLVPPLNPNSWIVFEAINADPLLSGLGRMAWQAKIQMTFNGVAYSDISGTNYGKNAQTDIVVMRSCPDGGWTGTPTFDFVPTTVALPSQDQAIYQGQDYDYYLDIVGDDDTIVWRGSAGNFPADTPANLSRGGYLGMTQRRNEDITWPFLMMTGKICGSALATGELAINRKDNTQVSSQWSSLITDTIFSSHWPTYSVGRDGTRVTAHRIDTWNITFLDKMASYSFTVPPDDVLPQMMYREHQSVDRYDILGELRMFVATNTLKGHSLVFGTTNDWIQICSNTATLGGIAMPWPSGIVPIW